MDSKNNEARISDEALEKVSGGTEIEEVIWDKLNPLNIMGYAMDICTGKTPYCPICGTDLTKLFPSLSIDLLDKVVAHIKGCADASTHNHDKQIGG